MTKPFSLRSSLASLLAMAALLAPTLRAQADQVITEKRVLECVSWLAADERRGRDTPSPELEASALWLADRFKVADLHQVTKDTWFHDYTLPGFHVDSRAITLLLTLKQGDSTKAFELQPDRDVRLLRPADAVSGKDESATVALSGDPALQQLLFAQSARRPIVVEVPEDHPYWLAAAGERSMLGGRRAASRPVFLVRKSLLPEAAVGDKESSWVATWSVPAAEKADLPLKNVVALLPGTDKKDEYVIVSAHYDHIGVGNPVDGDSINNGADDDATGTTAVVLIAEAMAKQKPPHRSVLFVCFSGEEKGLRGSAAFAEKPPVPREQIVANLNIEMIGRPEPGNEGMAWITGHDLSDLAEIAKTALERRSVGLVGFPMAAQLFAASDNYSFVRYGIVAHSISAGSLHKDYHKPSDEVAKLDIPHMTKIVSGLLEVVRELADREAPPVWNEAGRKRLERVRK